MKKTIKLLAVIISLCSLAGLSGCNSARYAAYPDDIYGGRQHTQQTSRTKPSKNKPGQPPSAKASKIIAEARRWIGTPYLYGGNTRAGIDCSGLTCQVFQAQGIDLPRSSREQAQYVKNVKYKDLRPADLIFFVSSRGGSRINHVAIYIGDGQILHSTTSSGVTITDLSDPYWLSHLYSCGRVAGVN